MAKDWLNKLKDDLIYIEKFSVEQGWGHRNEGPDLDYDLDDLIPNDEWEFDPDIGIDVPTEEGLEKFNCWQWSELPEDFEPPPLKMKWNDHGIVWTAILKKFDCVAHEVLIPGTHRRHIVYALTAEYVFDFA